MKKSAWLILLFLIWGAGSTYWYVCKIKGFCNQQSVMVTDTEDLPDATKAGNLTEEEKDFIYFDKNSLNPLVADNSKWTAEVKSLKDLQREGKKLFIYGPYYAWEETPKGYDNLGLARAEALKKLISDQIDTSFVFTRSRLLDDREDGQYVSGVKNGVFQWRFYNDYVKAKDLPGNVLIYFPNNSDREIRIKEIVQYLDDLADQLKKNPEMRIQVIGHTDATGSSDSNMVLSKKRAERIKNVLLAKGASSNQIEVLAKGESDPIADNTTGQGKQQNRRVEIKLIK